MTGISTFVDYQIVTRNMDRTRETLMSREQEQREIDYFRENIGNITSGEELLADQRLYRFSMRAFGLESQIYAKGLMSKVFEEGVEDRQSQANKMTDRRYREMAGSFGFAETGGEKTSDPNFVNDVVNLYTSVRLEEDQRNEGVRLALYFERKADGIDNWFEALADKALGEVVRVGLGFSKESAAGDIDRYAARLEERMPLEDLKDPEKLDKFLKTFAIRWDIENGVNDERNQARINLFNPLGQGGGGFGLDGATMEAALMTRT